ncbi:hypothetical protein D9611_012918 [Ephemerocybe angulata]|uniref:Uncharacterized protein n=1 Tax=Ephemerocybe angulata TaxID=980116 RepID=A0A8H5C477_9AGAR|nr:hypothetical protein D9611_012918 [Tulosesus angulatus]
MKRLPDARSMYGAIHWLTQHANRPWHSRRCPSHDGSSNTDPDDTADDCLSFAALARLPTPATRIMDAGPPDVRGYKSIPNTRPQSPRIGIGWPGWLCATLYGIVISLAPLKFLFPQGTPSMMQAFMIRGANYLGVSSPNTLDNVVPHIIGEEE